MSEPLPLRESANLLDLGAVALRHRWLILVACVLGGALGIAAYLVTAPVYRAETLLAPAGEAEQMPSPGGLGGFGGLFGISLGMGESSVYEAIAILESRSFDETFVAENQLLPALFYTLWDDEIDAWSEDVADDPPSLADAHRQLSGLREVTLDDVSGIVTVSLQWVDPVQAAEWTNLMIRQLNETLRLRAVREAENNIAFLKNELGKTSVVETRRSIYELMEKELAEIMLANTRSEYAFRVLSPAMPSDADEFVWPSLPHLVVAGGSLGMVAGVVLALIFEARRNRRGRRDRKKALTHADEGGGAVQR